MALKPVLKTKVDELFLRWLSDPDVQISLRGSLQQIGKGESVCGSGHQSSSFGVRGSSQRAGNALLSPGSPKLPSPRSPRRPLQTKKHNQDSNRPAIAVSSKEKEISNHVGQGGTPSPHSATSPAGLASQPSGDVIKPAPPPGVRDTNSSKYSGDDIRGLQPSAHDASSPSNRKQVARDADFQQPLQPHPRLQDAAADGKTGGGGGKLTPADVRENKENKPKKRA
ncbi:uncharacterized protein LOC101850289, partial [Aplysia californica]|uniref:Uncharacterized protein LOC101850289 n=1 Tax=Aplysia californica TaxID=6500 RepID=A0ABM0K7H1_APLCA